MANICSSLSILRLAEEDHVRCMWLHIWRTDKNDIEKNLKRHGISISEECETGQPIATCQRMTDQRIDLIKETFTTAQKSQGINAVRIKTKNRIIDTEMKNLTDQFRRCNVEVYKDRFEYMLWFVGKPDTVDSTKGILGNEPVEVSQCLRVPDLLLADAGKKIDDDESIQIQLNGQEKACILIFNLLVSAEEFRRPCIFVSRNRCPFNVQLDVKPRDMVGNVEKDVRRLLSEYQTKLYSEYLTFNDEEFTFLSNQEVFSYINSQVNISAERIDVVWFQEGGLLCVSSKDRRSSSWAKQTIKNAVKYESFLVSTQEFSSNNVHEALKAIAEDGRGKVEVKLNSDCSVITIIRTSDMISVQGKIQDLCDGEKVYLSQFYTKTYRAVFRQMKTVMDKNYRVDLSEEETSGSYNWVLRGVIEYVQIAKEKVKAFIRTLSTESKRYISDEDENTFKLKLTDIRDLEDLSAVMTEDASKDVNNDFSSEIDIRMAVSIRSWKLVCGGEIMILCCDVKRNPWLLKECVLVDVVPVEGIPTSTLIDVKPLKDFHVTRLFIPYWTDSKNNEKNVLESCIVSLLQTVSSRNFSSVSFVLSDVEKINWPISKFLKTILAVILERKPPQLSIRLCSSVINVCDECTTIIDTALIKNNAADTSPQLKIHVVRGELAKQETDVIVNSTNTHLKLSQGAVSGSILKHAGDGIQTECDRIIQSRGNLRPSEVVMTNAFKLKCGVVFHGTLPSWQKGSQKILEKFLENCLCEAERQEYRSIAFPALGTGKLGFPHDIVADTMLTSVERFARKRSTRYLQDVSFVIYQHDLEVIQVFEREEKIRRQKLSAVCHTEHFVKPPICAKVKVTVTAESTQAVQDIFKRIEDNLKCKTKQEVLIPEDMFNTPAIQKEPADQTMDRDTYESPVTPSHTTNGLGSSTSGETVDSAKSSESDKSNTSTHRNKEICFVELRLVDSNTSSPYEIFRKTVLKYGLEEDHLIWNELDKTVARIKFLNEDDAKAFVKRTRGDSCYEISIRSPDAVVNIRARLTNSSKDFLRSQEMQRQLVTQSGVGILMDQNDPVEIFGDLTSITSAHDLLRHWMSNIGKVKTKEEQEFLHGMGSVGRGKASSYLDDEKSETQFQPSVVDQYSITSFVRNEFSGTTEDNYKQSPAHESQSNQCTLRHNSGSESKSLENTDSLEHSFEMIEYAPPSDEHHSREDHDLKTKKDKPATDLSSSTNTNSGSSPKQSQKYDSRNKESPTQEGYDDIDLKDSLMLTTKEEINVHVYKADICRLKSIDCIVNSTNEDMKNSFGISKAIKNAAGRNMTEECQKYLATHDNKLSRDSVCVTASGNLSNFQRILHVQAPIWRNDLKEEDFSRSLSSTVGICLHQANKEKMTSIALPAISSGHGGAPRAARFKAYTDGVLEYSKKKGKKAKLKEIHFVDINQDVVDCIRGSFLYAVPEKETAYFSKSMKSIIPKKVVEMFKSNIRANDQAGKDLKYFFMDKKVIVVACDGGLINTRKHTHMDSVLCLEGIGEFNQKATAVVITEDSKLSGNSKSSMVCQKRGGSSFLKNYKSIKKTKTSKNVCGILGGDDLPFHHVFCVLMPNLEQDALRKHSHQQTKFFQDFAVCCQNMLQEADKAGIEHLSMPVLGPDDYNTREKWFPKLCITNMMNEIRNYAFARVQKKFIILHIVTDGKDDLLHIINQEMSEWKRNQ